jgi:hypothetical protein
MHIKPMKYLILIILLFPLQAFAENICDPVKSNGEGHWPIPEEAFTKENALKALEELQATFKKNKGPFLSPKELGGLDISPYVMERLIVIKGFYLKSDALSDIPLGEEYAKWSRKAFCTFLEEEALAWH